MSVLKDFALPDLGEGLTESEIVSWHVSVGDTVTLNQIIAEVETAKALVELPSPFAGVVSQLYAEPGSTVQVGAPIVAFEVDDGAQADASSSEAAQPEAARPEPARSEAASSEAAQARAIANGVGAAAGRQPVLVGYGPKVESGERPRRKARTADRAAATNTLTAAPAGDRPRSTPPVRKRARDLGVDLAQVAGTGDHGLVTREDIEAYVSRTESAAQATPVAEAGVASGVEPPRRGARPAETRIPITGVRRRMAQAMVASAFSAPHVTEFLTVDVTPTMELLESLGTKPAFREHRLNVLTMVAKALCIAVDRTPEVNARWDEAAGEIVRFGSVNLGIAAATDRGLIVPNVHAADRLNLLELADALGELTTAARAGRTTPAQLTGGTITITNVGVFGVDAGTPILNPGEAAILAMGAVRRQPWEHRGEIALRQVMTLSLSFDHRMVDGEQGSRFLVDIASILAEPGLVLAMV
jgi:2-oxoisovalerate dehydrogenase E2 component (dihydrolipoyl transacylase)